MSPGPRDLGLLQGMKRSLRRGRDIHVIDKRIRILTRGKAIKEKLCQKGCLLKTEKLFADEKTRIKHKKNLSNADLSSVLDCSGLQRAIFQ